MVTKVVPNDGLGVIYIDPRRSGRVVLFHKDTHGRINRIVLSKDGVHSLCDILTEVVWARLMRPLPKSTPAPSCVE
jgi:hypothetical protein